MLLAEQQQGIHPAIISASTILKISLLEDGRSPVTQKRNNKSNVGQPMYDFPVIMSRPGITHHCKSNWHSVNKENTTIQ